jgi:hypothetical protein
MPTPDNIALGIYGNDQVQSYAQILQNNAQLQAMSQIDINNKNAELLDKQSVQLNQFNEIEDKEKLLLTRARMLQISQDRNAYKKKIIYTLIALIFGIFIFTLVMYVLFVRKISMIKNK